MSMQIASVTERTVQDKIFCANCLKCKKVLVYVDYSKTVYRERVRCSAGMWKLFSGKEKLFKYYTIMRRCMTFCPEYESMGNDVVKYLEGLSILLPSRDAVYNIDGSLPAIVRRKGMKRAGGNYGRGRSKIQSRQS